MENKKILMIVGGAALLGGIAYVSFKEYKKRKGDVVSGTTNGQQQSSGNAAVPVVDSKKFVEEARKNVENIAPSSSGVMTEILTVKQITTTAEFNEVSDYINKTLIPAIAAKRNITGQAFGEMARGVSTEFNKKYSDARASGKTHIEAFKIIKDYGASKLL